MTDTMTPTTDDPAVPRRRPFWSLVRKTETCWIWMGARSKGRPTDYGSWCSVRAHRHAYELTHGKIPEGLTIDHLCRNTLCVNPAHLEAVTIQENIRRGTRATKTHCVNGHPFDESNTIKRRGGGRGCRDCDRDRVNPAIKSDRVPCDECGRMISSHLLAQRKHRGTHAR